MARDTNIARAILCWIASAGILYVVFTDIGITTFNGIVATVFAIALIIGGLYFASK